MGNFCTLSLALLIIVFDSASSFGNFSNVISNGGSKLKFSGSKEGKLFEAGMFSRGEFKFLRHQVGEDSTVLEKFSLDQRLKTFISELRENVSIILCNLTEEQVTHYSNGSYQSTTCTDKEQKYQLAIDILALASDISNCKNDPSPVHLRKKRQFAIPDQPSIIDSPYEVAERLKPILDESTAIAALRSKRPELCHSLKNSDKTSTLFNDVFAHVRRISDIVLNCN